MEFKAMIAAPCVKRVSRPALKGRENRERLRPYERKSIGILPLQGAGRRGMGVGEISI
jgi:hypothetical protein